jgi:hypothetical protein
MSLPAPGAVALAALLAATPAPTPAPEDPLPAAVLLTVSGGATLGAYQAGFLHYLAAARQAGSGQGPEVRLATGASAGSINSLLSLLYTQGGVEPDPYAGLFARVWLDTGFRELFLPERATALGAFSGASLAAAADRVRARLEQGLPESVDVVLGVAATRVTPRQRSLAGGRTSIPRTEEKFVLRIQGRGPGRMPRITSYPEADLDEEQIVLPSQPDGTVAFDDVKALLLASAAFPVAFQPQPVRHCMVRTRGGSPPWCPSAEATSALFLDGGVFDNAPLRLAAWLAAAGLADDPDGLRWRDAPTPGDVRPPRRVTFAFLSADARDYPGPAATSPVRPTESLPRLLGEEAAAFVTTARSKELDGLLTDYPHVAEGLVYPQRHIPAASEPLQAFFGFFERSFREFDFTLGMYEARRQLVHETMPRYRKRWGVGGPTLPEGATADARPWRPLLCMQAVLDGEARADALCSGEDLATFRILLQVSLERLWSACQPSPPRTPPPSSFRSCAPVLAGRPLPAVPGVTPAPDFARREGEGEAVYAVRLLAAHGFRWTDMGMGQASEEQALAGLREQLGRVAGTLAAQQPDLATRSAVGVAGRFAADAFHYQPPRSALWLLFGRGLEIGGSTAVIDEGWFRLGGALIVQNLLGAMSSDPTRVGLMPVAGVDFVPGTWGSTVFQPSFQVRAGYLFDFSDAGCTGTDGLSIGACSRGELEAGAAVTVISVIRFQLSFQWYPPARGAPGLWALAPSLGLQLGF